MKKSLALTALAAVSLAACSSAPATDADPSTNEDALTVAWPRGLDGKGCVSRTPSAQGHVHLKLRERSGDLYASVEVYDPSTGDLKEAMGFSARKRGGRIVLYSTASLGTYDEAVVLRSQSSTGALVTTIDPTNDSVLRDWLGNGPVDVVCDVDPGAQPVANPARARQKMGTTKAVSGRLPFPTPDESVCLGAAKIAAGDDRGRRMRLYFDNYVFGNETTVRARVEVYDEASGFVLWSERAAVRRDSAGNYEMFTSSSLVNDAVLAKIRPARVGNATVMTFEAVDEGLKESIAGVVPLACDFL